MRTRVSQRFEVKFSMERLLGNLTTYTQGGDVLRQYDLGRKFSLGLTWAAFGSGFVRLPNE